jgi:hypothetical protein
VGPIRARGKPIVLHRALGPVSADDAWTLLLTLEMPRLTWINVHPHPGGFFVRLVRRLAAPIGRDELPMSVDQRQRDQRLAQLQPTRSGDVSHLAVPATLEAAERAINRH